MCPAVVPPDRRVTPTSFSQASWRIWARKGPFPSARTLKVWVPLGKAQISLQFSPVPPISLTERERSSFVVVWTSAQRVSSLPCVSKA